MPFRPAPFPTVAVAVGLAILVNLGTWQLRRHDQAEAQRAILAARRTLPPATAADLARPTDELAWREAALTGHYTGDGPFLVAGRFELGRHGYAVIEPFDVDDGPVVLVDRGFVAADVWADVAPTLRDGGTTTVRGLLLPIEGRGDVRPLPADATHPERWPMETARRLGCEALVGPPYAAIAARAGDVAPVYLTLGPALEPDRPRPSGTWPLPGYHAAPKYIGHLQYAAQWFLIAATLLVIWVGTGFSRGRHLAGGADR